MGYVETLDVVGRLCSDPIFQERFLRDAGAALASLELSAEERSALASINRNTVLLIGRLGSYHRILRIQENAPWVDPLLRPDLMSRLQRFMAEVRPKLLNREDALAFFRHVTVAAPGEPPYLAELGRYEFLRLSVAWTLDPTIGPQHQETFQYPLLRVLELLQAPGWPEVAPTPSRLEFKKVPGLPAVIVHEV